MNSAKKLFFQTKLNNFINISFSTHGKDAKNNHEGVTTN